VSATGCDCKGGGVGGGVGGGFLGGFVWGGVGGLGREVLPHGIGEGATNRRDEGGCGGRETWRNGSR